MLYTTTASDHQVDRIRLFPSPEAAAEADANDVRTIHGVAVTLDRGVHRVIPLWTDPQVFDSAWTAPAELLADRSIIARCPIPAPLFVHDLDVLAEAI
ncbi:hypothetical protein V5E97_38430 [Singulisphaera sp. Ch08]|uniref:DUF2750 domain-containing protein n=1 Tax=Singulisphaera sp. Ch08 TaxID=3120278 RepID=A0AAU7CF59_9BACT